MKFKIFLEHLINLALQYLPYLSKNRAVSFYQEDISFGFHSVQIRALIFDIDVLLSFIVQAY